MKLLKGLFITILFLSTFVHAELKKELLFYVGIKMLISEFYKIPTEISLVVILIFLGGSIVLSLIKKKRFSQ